MIKDIVVLYKIENTISDMIESNPIKYMAYHINPNLFLEFLKENKETDLFIKKYIEENDVLDDKLTSFSESLKINNYNLYNKKIIMGKDVLILNNTIYNYSLSYESMIDRLNHSENIDVQKTMIFESLNNLTNTEIKRDENIQVADEKENGFWYVFSVISIMSTFFFFIFSLY